MVQHCGAGVHKLRTNNRIYGPDGKLMCVVGYIFVFVTTECMWIYSADKRIWDRHFEGAYKQIILPTGVIGWISMMGQPMV